MLAENGRVSQKNVEVIPLVEDFIAGEEDLVDFFAQSLKRKALSILTILNKLSIM